MYGSALLRISGAAALAGYSVASSVSQTHSVETFGGYLRVCRGLGLTTAGLERYPRGAGLVAVLLLERLLNLKKIHAHAPYLGYSQPSSENYSLPTARLKLLCGLAEGEAKEFLVVSVEVEHAKARFTERPVRRL